MGTLSESGANRAPATRSEALGSNPGGFVVGVSAKPSVWLVGAPIDMLRCGGRTVPPVPPTKIRDELGLTKLHTSPRRNTTGPGLPSTYRRRLNVRAASGARATLIAFAMLVVAGCGVSSLRVATVDADPDIRRPAGFLGEPPGIAIRSFSLATGASTPFVIGEALTGLNDRVTDIISDESVDLIVTRAVARGFKDAGCRLVSEDEADLILDGTVLSFWASEDSSPLRQNSKASVVYELELRDSVGGAIWSSTMRSFKASEGSIETTGHNVPTLAAALTESVEAIFVDPRLWDALSGR